MTKRIQRRRIKGWRMPEGAVYVGRGSKWGNPFTGHSRQVDVEGFRAQLAKEGCWSPIPVKTWPRDKEGHLKIPRQWTTVDAVKRELRGKDLACWCPVGDGQPCHADVLLEIANGGAA